MTNNNKTMVFIDQINTTLIQSNHYKMTINTKTDPPKWWQNLSRALRFLAATLMITFSSTDMYSPDTCKRITFWLGIGVVILQACDILFGTAEVKPEPELEIPVKKV